ncbi:ATP-binding protein [Sphingomonas sp. dw_22]|uniref:sensor histidine kinase n=1 Tax=Sphingomonas sp. dw_22 TaxID=2721175 RepID=UPI001BD55523|nr:ATP-binding protein [Sphingomonas sp. dw_22]
MFSALAVQALLVALAIGGLLFGATRYPAILGHPTVIAGAAVGIFAILLVAANLLARRWTRPHVELYRLSRAAAEGDEELAFEEIGPPETVATMRNLQFAASRFNRLENARRTWLVSISEELKRPAVNFGEHFIALCALRPPLPEALLDAIEEDARRLINIADDLDAVALADLGRFAITPEETDARALAHNAVLDHQPRAQAQGVELIAAELPEHSIPVEWDAARIAQVLDALIDNALRYTPAGGRISIGLEGARDAWRLIVDDSAPGVDVGLAQSLFDPFYRSAGGDNVASPLALATARAIVEAHHGRVEASASPIGGLRVSVVLPIRSPTS